MAPLVLKKSDFSIFNVNLCLITIQVYFEMASPFFNAFHGLFSIRPCELNPTDLGNIPPGLSGYFEALSASNEQSQGKETKNNKISDTNPHDY